MNVMGIIFANDDTANELTTKRTMASLPFGGRYRQVDFHLANLCAGGISHLGIVSRSNYQSLMNHVGSGEEWGLEMGEGGLEFLTPGSLGTDDRYRGKLENLHAIADFMTFADEDYVVLSDSSILTNMDIKDVVAKHIASGKDITIVAKPGIANGEKVLDLAVKVDNGEVSDIVVNYAAQSDYLASMDIFVVGRKWLLEKVEALVARDKFHMDRDLVLGQWVNNSLTVNVYEYTGVALYNETLEDYFANSLSLLGKDVAYGIFHGHHDVYTKVRDRVPTYYGEASVAANCLVADGCMIDGDVQNSVLFRQVTVAEDAKIDSCVIMNNTIVGKGAELKYVILDKDVEVRPGVKISGTPEKPYVVQRGKRV